MQGCKDCDNALFDERYGEYKCKKKNRYIYKTEEQLRCEDWKEGTPGESKYNREEEDE